MDGWVSQETVPVDKEDGGEGSGDVSVELRMEIRPERVFGGVKGMEMR